MKLLIVTGRLFYPANTGGKTRSSKLFERLSRQHDVTIACFRTPAETAEQVAAMRACCSRLDTIDWRDTPKFTPRFYGELALGTLSPDAYTITKYTDARMRRRLDALLRTDRFDAVISDFLQPSRNVIAVPFRPRILFQHNVESIIRYRQYRQATNAVAKAYLWWDWIRLRRYEGCAARQFDHCIMVSEEDCRTMVGLYGVRHTSAIPTGVDVEYFRPREPEAEGHHIVFTGSMDWLPNVDAGEFFIRDILPRISRTLDVVFWIVGRNPSPRLDRLAGSRADVRVTGTVDDVRPYIDRAAVYVVPLRIGGGTRIKIFEAMAMQKAIVSTRIGAEGLPVADGEHLVLADDPARFADAVTMLLRNPTARRTMGQAARRHVADRYTWDVAAARFGEICQQVVERSGKASLCA